MTLSTYLDIPVLDWLVDWGDPSMSATFTQVRNQLGDASSPGPLAFDAPHQPRPRTSTTLRYVLCSRQEMVDARTFIRDTCQGRRNRFWVPLWAKAFAIVDDVAEDATEVTITRSGYTDWMAGEGYGREHVAFFPRVPSAMPVLTPRHIESSTVDVDAGTETLVLSSAIGTALSIDDLATFLILARIDTDTPLLDWESFATGTLEIPVVDLPLEAASAFRDTLPTLTTERPRYLRTEGGTLITREF